MVILLAGVWIVSFPPGGNRGIDIGAWGEPEEIALDGESEGEITFEHYEDEPLPMTDAEGETRPSYNLDDGAGLGIDQPRVPSRSPSRVVRLSEDSTVIEYERDEQAFPRISPTSTRSSRSRRQTDSALLSSTYGVAPGAAAAESPRTPPRRGRPSLYGAQGSTLGAGGTVTSPPRQSFPSYSPSTPSGFSIGLSPVSPGFALVPRRRRMTSMEGISDLSTSRSGRRIVSEGSMSGAGLTRGDVAQTGIVPGQNRTSEESRGGDASASNEASGNGTTAGRPAKGRWKL